jgi:predicted transcriptional regulator of viral defense system
MKVEEAIAEISELPISTQVLFPLLVEYKRPYDKINELVKSGYLYQIKRGLYMAGPKIKKPHPEPFLLANHLYGPSYITAESALSYWGLIPEKVVGITSTTTRKATVFKTHFGVFYYFHLSIAAYFIGLSQVKLTNFQTVMIATPEKALCDLIVQKKGLHLRSVKQTLQFLEEDLRLDLKALTSYNKTIISDCVVHCPKSTSLQLLSKTIHTYA